MISIPRLRISLFVCAVTAVLLLHSTPSSFSVPVQKADPTKFEYAVNRSADAGRIITLLAVTPDEGLPKEIAQRAEAIGVFPKVVKESQMFSQHWKGYGVISTRTEKGWTLPAFYQFSGNGFGNPFSNSESYAVILLFMTKDSLKWFDKGRVLLTNRQKVIEGPVGAVTEAQLKALADVPVLAYAYYNGKLNGQAFGRSFWDSFDLNPDNNINKPVYGIKGREVLAGEAVNQENILEGIAAYQAALTKYYSR
jgi:lipid-binding SYLF domain-containing protein